MGLFGWGKKEGFSDVIRCDEPEYLVWKWRPYGDANSTTRENAIRYGSSLRVKDGELAVFVYKSGTGPNQDFIYGPHDRTIQTSNFPILSSIVGLAFGGESPFQAEIYFINLAGNIQIRFGIPYFDVFDPRFLDFAVPIAVRGTLTFNIRDPQEFIKLNRLINFDLETFKNQVKDAVVKYSKGVIANAPQSYGIPVLQIERSLLQVSDIVAQIRERLSRDFGVNVKDFDLAAIEVQKESHGYKELRSITADLVKNTTIAQNELTIKNMHDAQRIGVANAEESLKVSRQETQRGQRLNTESANLAAHTVNVQADVLKTAAANMGSSGSVNLGGGGDGFNPGTMMAGMAVGGAMGNQIAGMMNNMSSSMPVTQPIPPPPPATSFFLAVDGAAQGPYTLPQIVEMIQSGRVNAAMHVHKVGGSEWQLVSQNPQLAPYFPPPPPPSPANT
jgi:membrane protease subunit (stomatin/prohibitin family)